MSDYTPEEVADKFASASKKVGGKLKWIIAGLVLLLVGYSSTFTTDLGYNYVVQDTLFKSKRLITTPAVNFKVPFGMSKVTKYKQVATISFGSEKGDAAGPVAVTFADTYEGKVPVTFRFRLPRSEKEMFKAHDEFRSYDNLVNALLVKNGKNVTVVTGTQYTGEEFFQGGLNSFKVKLEDQLSNGLYETERRKVAIEQTDTAPISADNSDNQKLQTRTQMVWKNVILKNDNGQAKRLVNPLDEYGITVTQVTIDKPDPEERLKKMLNTKKDLVAQRISAEQQIITAKAQAKAAQNTMEIEKTIAIQKADKVRQLAIINRQQEVAVEQEQVKLEKVKKNKEVAIAILQKSKELQIAQANRGIQEANAEAAKFQADAIKAKGLAEAAVDRAKLQAKQSAKDVYMAALQADVAITMYRNLKNFKVDMPRNVVQTGGGSSSLPSNLDVLSTFGALGAMDSLGKKVATQDYTQGNTSLK